MCFAKPIIMKLIYTIAITFCSLLFACNNNGQSTNSTSGTSDDEPKKISKRDYSVTNANAYNDLALDSNNLVRFISENKVPDSIGYRMISLYNARNYHYAWFSSKGLTEQALGFWNLHNYEVYTGDTSLKHNTLQKKMDALTADDDGFTVSTSDKSIANTELMLTQHFIQYALDNYEKGTVKRKELERFIPIKKEDAVALADSLINKKHKDNRYFEAVNEDYKRVKVQLARFLNIAKKGGWQSVPVDVKQYKPGSSSPAILALKKRLQVTGELPATDTSAVYSNELTNAIKQVQQTFGYTPDGKMSATLIKDLNVPVTNRLQQLLINLNRMRWMPQEPDGKLILVNIPEFVLHFVDGRNKVFDMNVVVGKEGHNTMMFTGKLSTIVFSPYWNVPPSIVKKEILPKMASNPGYLESQNMEIVGNEGGLPAIRQRPGDKNSLGKVKFLFPNSFNIYFHDTPAKSLFSQDKRAYSHGCIRLSEPDKMAEYLLKDNPNWPTDKIYAAMNSGEEQSVKIKNPIPVFITYYTAWVNETGILNFRDDIYGRDAELTKKMF
ncbi:hypothetical protein BH09BAC2_BH09BAC2_13860 [soil metagenome]